MVPCGESTHVGSLTFIALLGIMQFDFQFIVIMMMMMNDSNNEDYDHICLV